MQSEVLWIVFCKWAPSKLAQSFPSVWRDLECASIRARHDKWYAYYSATQNHFANVFKSIPKDLYLECLQRAIKSNHIENVRILMDKVDVQKLDTVCLSFANLETFKILKDKVNLLSDELLSNVVHHGTIDVVEELLQCGNSLQQDNLSDALTNVRGSEMLQQVLDRVELDWQEQDNLMNETLQLMDNEPCRIVASHPRIERGAVQEALLSACEMGQSDKVQVLMQFSDPSFPANQGIRVAAENEQWDIVELLLEDPKVNPWDAAFGPQIFLHAVSQDELCLARVLLEHRAYEGQYARDIYESLQGNPDVLNSFRGLIAVKRIKT